MRTRIEAGAIYIVILIGALLLNALAFAPAGAQAVPTWDGTSWTLPANDPGSPTLPIQGQVTSGGGGGYEAVAYEACAVHGCDGAYLISIMNCESGQDPNAYHPNPYGGADIGIMQINDATWGSIAYAGPVEQIWWAAEMIANGMAHHWVCA